MSFMVARMLAGVVDARAGFVQIRPRAQSDLPYRQVAPRVLNAHLRAYNFADH
ncbi:MAG TPA: hypothetical protein VFS67_09050 [Polyangiaceae bacterium]|jgi:hypothetical protein|nr:hypothetical protein [Polyangiaceae bacterium]